METFVSLLIPALLGVMAVRLLALPLQWFLKAAVHGLGGFLCLALLNLVSGFTGICFPVNAVTIAIAGFLGIPGIALLTVLEILL